MSIAAVFQIGSLGDSIVSLPVIRSLRDLIPGCSEYIVVSRFETKMNIMPHHIFDMTWKSKRQISYLGKGGKVAKALSIVNALAQLRYYKPQQCVYLLPSERSAPQVQRDIRFFRLAGVRDLIGFHSIPPQRHEWAGRPNVENTEAFLRFQRVWGDEARAKFCHYAQTPVLEPGEAATARVEAWLRDARLLPGRRLVAVCPFSNYPSRTLSEAVIVDLLQRLRAASDVEPVLLGGAKDSVIAQRIITNASAGLNACGIFSPAESAALLKRCALAICAESGPMHLAGAIGTPSVVTFSRISKDLDQWLPLGKGHTVLYQDGLGCAGCGLTHCTVEGHPCMSRFGSDAIFEAASARLTPLPVLPDLSRFAAVLNW